MNLLEKYKDKIVSYKNISFIVNHVYIRKFSNSIEYVLCGRDIANKYQEIIINNIDELNKIEVI